MQENLVQINTITYEYYVMAMMGKKVWGKVTTSSANHAHLAKNFGHTTRHFKFSPQYLFSKLSIACFSQTTNQVLRASLIILSFLEISQVFPIHED